MINFPVGFPGSDYLVLVLFSVIITVISKKILKNSLLPLGTKTQVILIPFYTDPGWMPCHAFIVCQVLSSVWNDSTNI